MKPLLLATIILPALLMTAACVAEPDAERAAEPAEMRSYSLPEGTSPNAALRLRSSLSKSLDGIGTAAIYPDRSLVVTAPKSVHDDVARLLKSMAEREPVAPPAAPEPVTIRYWAILATADDGSTRGAPPASFRSGGPLEPVAAQLREAYGPLRFSQLETLTLTSLDGDIPGVSGSPMREDVVRGVFLEINQRVFSTPTGERFVDVGFNAGRLNARAGTRVRLDEGKFIVLSQAGFAFDGNTSSLRPEGWDSVDDGMLIVVMTADSSS